ncbi:MAG: carbamoyltransferase [Chitinophagaceae bacterium]|nr:carbamoyltransferase [Chitinophagaceae bacterium]
MTTIGINATFHDSAACIIVDGRLLAAAEEERFTHIKHGKRPIPFSTYELPFHSINYCLEVAGIHINQVDHFAYSFDPGLLKKPEHEAFMNAVTNARLHLRDGYPHHLQKRYLDADIPENKWHCVDHHIAHAASAYLASPYTRAAVMTIDGRGENATTSYYMGHDNDLRKIAEVGLPHSLGLLYEKMTTYLGFLHSSDEYKVMALASYGKPLYADIFRSMISYKGDGTYTISDDDFVKHFGCTRLRDEPFGEVHFNIAHSLQLVLEETVLKLVDWLYEQTQEENLCLAGGVALNCVMNARIRDKGPFKNVWVQPAAGDSGTALGAALWVDAKERNTTERNFEMDHAYWGPEYSDQQIEKFLKWTKTKYKKLDNIAEEAAELLAADKIIGWHQGRMEFGPRALGSRSILASPINASMQARLNEVKDREDFRPVAPVVLEEDAAEWFVDAGFSPFMLFINDVRPDKADSIPAVRHTDGTARIQTVNRNQHPLYYDLLKCFKEKTGVPVLVNTSFNTLGKPIVCTPRDAIECFRSSPFDALVIGSFLLEK